jgi:hypothetical protein
MKAKLFSLFALSIFTFVFLISLASAATIFSDDFSDNNLDGWTITNDPATLSGTPWNAITAHAEAKPGISNTLGTSNLLKTINTSGYNTIIVKYDRQLVGFDTEEEFKMLWSADGITFYVLEETLTSTPNDASFVSKTFNLNSSADNANLQIKFECSTNAQTDLCKLDNVIIEGTLISASLTNAAICAYDDGITTNEGDLEVTIKGIEVKEGFGEDENWLATDEVEVEIRVENNGDYDIDDITLEWGIADEGLNDWVIEFDEIDEFNLKDGDEDIFTVTFILDEDDLDMDLEDIIGNDYNLVVRATGTIDDNDADEFDGDKTCSADFSDVSIEDSNAVILSNFQVPDSVSCGSTVEISADAWNIGDRDEDEVSVTITNKELKLSEDITLGDIDAFDNQKLSFTFTVPSDATEKSYNILFRVYDEDNDLYEVGEDDDPSEFNIELKVEGGCTDSASLVTVKADLVSGGKAGQDLVVKATLTNAGSNSATYTLSASDYGQFASQYDVQPSTLTLAAGKSGEATYTLKVSKDAFGEQMFYLELVSGSQVTRQPVSVTIQKAGLLDSITGSAISGNSLVWGLGLLNVILVIVIIFVAIRVARK